MFVKNRIDRALRRILSIDGGGIRGVFPAVYLAELEKDIDRPIHEYFDLIAGTSTGGIIAIGLAMGIPAREILKMYEKRGPEIFSQESKGIVGWFGKRLRKIRWLWKPKYDSKALESALSDVLHDLRIGDARTRLLIPAWQTTSRSVYVFKTAHHERFQTDYKDFARDAAMATAAAPTYFKEHVTARDIGLIDGGIWANNPMSIAVAEGIGTLEWNPSDIRVLSIGCLEDVTLMRDAYGAVGLVPNLAGLFMEGQSEGAVGLSRILTGSVGGASHEAIYRISPSVPAGIFTLDDADKINELKGLGVSESRKDKPKLLKVFFEKTAEEFKPVYKLEDIASDVD